MDNRPEGVYAEWISYPPEPLVGAAPLLRVERVNGDGSVSTVVLTEEEARELAPNLLRAAKQTAKSGAKACGCGRRISSTKAACLACASGNAEGVYA